MLTGKRKKVLMFIAIKLNCRMSQLMIQLKVNTETMKFMVCIYSREHLMTLNRNQKNSSTLKGVLLSHADARMILSFFPAVFFFLDRNRQGAKKVIFTACHFGKLKLTFTSPNIFQLAPKTF